MEKKDVQSIARFFCSREFSNSFLLLLLTRVSQGINTWLQIMYFVGFCEQKIYCLLHATCNADIINKKNIFTSEKQYDYWKHCSRFFDIHVKYLLKCSEVKLNFSNWYNVCFCYKTKHNNVLSYKMLLA